MAVIESGGVTNHRMVVDSDGRAHVDAHTETAGIAHTRLGHSYNINTGDITLTNATKITALYIKNTGTKDWVVDAVIYLTGNSTGGAATSDFVYTAILNPTAGDIITNTNNVDTNTNRNAGSSNSLTGVAYVGAQGETAVSGGTNLFGTRLSGSGRTSVPIPIVIPKSKSLAVDFTPKASNTSVTFQVAVSLYEQNLAAE